MIRNLFEKEITSLKWEIPWRQVCLWLSSPRILNPSTSILFLIQKWAKYSDSLWVLLMFCGKLWNLKPYVTFPCYWKGYPVFHVTLLLHMFWIILEFCIEIFFICCLKYLRALHISDVELFLYTDLFFFLLYCWKNNLKLSAFKIILWNSIEPDRNKIGNIITEIIVYCEIKEIASTCCTLQHFFS